MRIKGVQMPWLVRLGLEGVLTRSVRDFAVFSIFFLSFTFIALEALTYKYKEYIR